jgi:PBP1b-binding outer membrane lipoprotein LpoB
MMKKSIYILTATAVSLFLLGGCGGKSSQKHSSRQNTSTIAPENVDAHVQNILNPNDENSSRVKGVG